MAQEVANTHYVARVVIEKIDHMQEPAKSYVQGSEPEPKGRKVTELASLSLRNDDLEALKDRIGAHIALVDEVEAIDDRPKSAIRREHR